MNEVITTNTPPPKVMAKLSAVPITGILGWFIEASYAENTTIVVALLREASVSIRAASLEGTLTLEQDEHRGGVGW